MGLESGTYVNDLVVTNPVGATDAKQYGDDHLRLLKTVLKATFPGMAGAFNRVSAKGSGYTVVANDNTVLFNCTAGLTLSLTAAATLGNQHSFSVFANGGAVIIDPNGAELINGAATLTIPSGHFAWVWCNGSTFFADVAASLGTNTFTGLQTFAAGADIASATTVDLTAATGNLARVTGTVATTDFTINNGQVVFLYPTGAWPLTYNATTMPIKGGASYTCAAGDTVIVSKDGNGTLHIDIIPMAGLVSRGAITTDGITMSTARLLGRTTAATGAVEEITVGSGLSLSAGALTASVITLDTPVASTSGTSIDFTSIPSGTKRITINFAGVSLNGTAQPLIQIGDSGGVETSGYLGASSSLVAATASLNYTAGFGIYAATAANTFHGTLTLTLLDASANTWCAAGYFATSNVAATFTSAGSKSLSAVLDRVRITSSNGTDTFDAGAINITYE